MKTERKACAGHTSLRGSPVVTAQESGAFEAAGQAPIRKERAGLPRPAIQEGGDIDATY